MMMPKLTLVFADGDVSCVDVRSDETLLAAARRNGVSLASDCEVGDCQTCHARIVAGDVEYDEYATISLSTDEVAAGEVLTCVATATSDVTVQLPYQRGHLLPARPFTMKVQSVARVCESVVRLSARVTARTPLGFLPGQYVNLKIPGTDQWRSYSMANAASADGFEFEFLMRLLDAGVMSCYLSDRATAGDVIEAKGPFGTFYLRDNDKPVLMVAGGTGLAPMVSMLRAMIAKNSSRSIILCFGVTRPADLFYLEELNALRVSLPLLDLRIAIMQGDALPHVSGVATDLIRPQDVAGRDIYLCGPPAMTDRARTVLAEQGADPSSVFVERFVPVSGAEVEAPVTAQLAGAES
jgi:benzoate/toluate 1,2-dioxygenase reductase subunit